MSGAAEDAPAAVTAARAKALEVNRRLTAAYPVPEEKAGRLPPVDELVCTILSQNTTDTTRDRAFVRLQAAYPDWEAVRDAPTDDVEEHIRVAGLANQKAPRIQRALRAISEETGGDITLDFLREMSPEEARDWLMDIKGVGIKTASIVLLFALGMPALPVDTHVHRVSRRLGLIPEGMRAARAHHALEEIVPEQHYLPFHVALITHGRRVCRARTPRCDECSLTDLCAWYSEHRTETADADRP